MLLFYIIISIVFAIFLILLNILLSHGNLKIKGFISSLIYGLGVGAPTMLASYYKWNAPTAINHYLLLLIAFIFIVPVLATSWYNVIKGRESAYHIILLTTGMFLTFISFLFNPYLAMISVAAGWLFFILYFVYLYRYPYLNSAWLMTAVEQTVKEIRGKGKYSTKPVVIKKEINRRFVTGFLGLSLIIKKDRAIGKISRKLHLKCGEPNLEVFFNRLLDKIIEYDSKQKNKKKESR
jgi:hypothetical protein